MSSVEGRTTRRREERKRRACFAPASSCSTRCFSVDEFPPPDGKVQAKGFFAVNGGCAANAAVAIARLGGRAALAAPMGGPAGKDDNGDRVLAALSRENVDCSACQRIDGYATALSAIFINARGDRMIVTYRDERIATAAPADPEGLVAAADIVLADNRYPAFVTPICAAARRRGLAVVLDGDRPTVEDDPLFRLASHIIFSSECLRETTGVADLGEGLCCIARNTDAFLAVSNGPDDIIFCSRVSRAGCRFFRSKRSTRSAPATRCTAASRSRLPRARARSRRCALARRSPASNAAGLAAPAGCRRARRSRLCWPSAGLRAGLI